MYLNVENGRFLYNCTCSCIPLRENLGGYLRDAMKEHSKNTWKILRDTTKHHLRGK